MPRQIENLLPACKNLGTTHITNNCFRLHAVEWAIGEAAGALVAFCLDSRLSSSAVPNTPGKLAPFQSRLTAQGAELAWPKVLPR
ncbi:MAG: FAD-dependent oxidoreductase [Isosphaeraceae bacterium]